MRVTCFFFFLSCKSSCATCIHNTTVVFIKKLIQIAKKKLSWLAVSKAENS